MRVLYVNADSGVPLHGPKGASVHVRSMALAFSETGHDVSVVTCRLGVPSGPPSCFPVPAVAYAPDGSPAGVSPLLACTARERAKQHRRERDTLREIARVFRPDFLYERYSLWHEAGLEVSRELGVPHVLEVNAPLVEESLRYRSLPDPEAALEIAGRLFRGASAVLVVSRALAAYARGLGAELGRVHLFPNAVDRRLFAPEAGEGGVPDPRPFTLGFCGGLRPWHGVDDLLRIFFRVRERVPEARLLVVGDGPGRARLEETMAQAGALDRLELRGHVDHAGVPALLRRMDVALAPYPALQPFYFSPLKILEYLAASLPVVAAAQGDIPEYVRHEETGLLYPAGQVEEAAEGVLRLRADRALAARLGRAGRASVLAAHTWDRRAAQAAELAAGLRRTTAETLS